MTHERKMTMKPDGTLYPSFYQRVLPGDYFRGDSEIFGRMLPLVNPVFQRFDVFVHYFFVPDRLIWDNFEQWISPTYQGEIPNEQHNYPAFKVRPTASADYNSADIDNFKARSLADCFGIQLIHDTEYGHMPLAFIPDISFSSMPFRAYRKIWNEHYRDVDIQEEVFIAKTDGYIDSDEQNQFQFLKRNWEKDYFTGARPFAQKGQPVSVMNRVPISQADPNYPNGSNPNSEYPNQGAGVLNVLNGSSVGLEVDSNGYLKAPGADEGASNIQTGGYFTIADLRWANAMQKYAEKMYRGGSRYTNFLRNFFGVKSSDARIDRSEYIGGGRQPFTIGEVLQTTPTDTSPLGTYGGHAVTFGQHKFNYRVEEHGQIIGLISIMPRASYMNTISKQLVINDVFDYPLPDFAHLGNQPVMHWEMSGDMNSETPFQTFGYQDRYAEYKFIPSTVHGLFREDSNLKLFHAARQLEGDTVALNQDFLQVTDDDNTDRIYAVEMNGPFSTDPILINVVNRITAVRPLPKKSIPGLN